jgi:hypothetical protein
MAELDAEITQRVRGIAFVNHVNAKRRCELVYTEARPGALLLAREADFWRALLDVIDGIRTPTRDQEWVLAQVREPLEGVALAKARAAANKATKAAANGKSRADRLARVAEIEKEGASL